MQLLYKVLGRLRIIFYGFCKHFQRGEEMERSDVRIDVVIPAVEKHLKTLPLCLQGIRRCVTQRITNIYVIAPCTCSFLQFCDDEKVTFVDENSVLGYGVQDVVCPGIERKGWMFQQLLKLAGNVGKEEYYLVCDADHVLLRPHCFVTKEGKIVFYQSREFHPPYYKNMRELLGKLKLETLSYVDHKMLFSKKKLIGLKLQIEQKYSIPWDSAICQSLGHKTGSSFSEYELFGHFVPHKDKIKKLWLNKDLPNGEIITYPELQHKYAKHFRCVTFPCAC